MHVIGCQFDLAWEDKPASFARVRALLEGVEVPARALIVLPEMFATGFSMNAAAIAEPEDGETAAFLAGLARANDAYILGGMVTRGADGRGRNQAVVFGPDGGERARYTKMHPFTYGGEAAHYAAGERPVLFDWEGVTVAPFICYDLRFPEIFRRAAVQGAELFAVIANWPEARVAHWETLLAARAIENQAFVVGVNRSGRDPNLCYPGRSRLLGPRGESLAEGGEGSEPLRAELDPADLRAYRAALPFLEDIRRDQIRTE